MTRIWNIMYTPKNHNGKVIIMPASLMGLPLTQDQAQQRVDGLNRNSVGVYRLCD